MEETNENTGLNLYQGVRGLAVKILNRVDRTDAYLDKLLEIEIKNSNLVGADKALLFEIVHGVTRWEGRIDWILTGFYKGQFSKAIPNIKNALRVALYQILFLDKVPDYAAVNEAVEFVKKLQGQAAADLTNAVLRNIIRNKENIRYPNPDEDINNYLSAYFSHPTWLVKRWLARFGREETEKLLIANNNKPNLTIRVNNLVTNPTEMKSLLNSVELKFSEGKFLKEFIRMNSLTNITDWEYFAKGYFSIQDESTGFPIKLLNISPGMRVLDLCAAPGGKTGFIADEMKNTGEIVAIDKFESRLKILEKNLTRLKVTNVVTKVTDAADFEDEEGFDRVLIDAPCSGLGTLTKKPDLKWKRDLGDIRKIVNIQYELLKKGASLVKQNGFIVYSTCTIEPEENFELIKKFLSENPNFALVNAGELLPKAVVDENGCVATLPHVHGIDGAFAAKLVRNN
ncbi:MAG: 16S rRNA (cytosine(967)-C(5))-methyltransferase [Stygiobacter sp. RIFOXYC12_FULL_38_8]|nr:MAG: 16S rRNA (cytosine(967)-C(5))-methyltransferase [Stygiobacter sp. GWC2_38_9]OGU79877.1 MAG: 16S rRNA (cytosine(967)-C(5))-methyltransferase [Stygiobacter sp. RIFOXYA12_FULL_38_9]OGV08169.1 MAG: 16S rRNA (cytosine(967)-C(5))-methyltransferase [Stygiobacter sp. RIFOXYB2_FULL_37_11]OGV11293.1 MAG: 16S rRNA (cytosine(967)-C(5))-methyltransferase [Stygiobacter sp. RIFOXYA2_FULL_38_8]OGV15685.1 MAG: 16S rRNA (cytosine(967)-C(5))-methyltransferase [Stygiobacter sp. RIFOXYC2_FULL_38_25]OGV2249